MNAPVWKSMTIANLGWGTIDLLHYDSTDSDDKDNYITHKRKSKIMTNFIFVYVNCISSASAQFGINVFSFF